MLTSFNALDVPQCYDCFYEYYNITMLRKCVSVLAFRHRYTHVVKGRFKAFKLRIMPNESYNGALGPGTEVCVM